MWGAIKNGPKPLRRLPRFSFLFRFHGINIYFDSIDNFDTMCVHGDIAGQIPLQLSWLKLSACSLLMLEARIVRCRAGDSPVNRIFLF